MSEITVNNTDAGIVAGVKSALEAATICGVQVFQQVVVAASEEAARQTAYTHRSVAVVVYLRTQEHRISDRYLGCVVHLHVLVAARGDGDAARTEAALRLQNAAQNALSAAPPAQARAFAAGEQLFRRIEFGPGAFKADPPWATCTLSVAIAYTIENESSR